MRQSSGGARGGEVPASNEMRIKSLIYQGFAMPPDVCPGAFCAFGKEEGRDSFIFCAADLIHPVVRDDDVHVKIRGHERGELRLAHQRDGDRAGRARVVPVEHGATHAVRDGQAAAGLEQRCQMRDQARRVGEVREGVVDHAAVKRLRERHGLNVAAAHGHARIRELFGSAPGHFRGNVHTGDAVHVPRQIVREEHARAACHVEHVYARADAGVVEDGADDRLIADHFRVPVRGAAVEKTK